jgi:polyisoprenoid-binding protein YceI
MRRLTLALLLLAAAPLFAQTYVVDKSHSAVQFKIRHMMSQVGGRFADFSGTIAIDRAALQKSSVEFTVQTASITTNTPDRDKHLRSADFFDVEQFPTITFKSTGVAQGKSQDTFNVSGDLTIHGVTKRVLLPVNFLGTALDPQKKERAGFEINTKLNRIDYGITWNRNMNPGGVLLADDVDIAISLEAVKQ